MIEKFLNDFLAQLGAGSKEMVYVSVTPGVGLEMIQVDPVLKAVKLYGYKPLAYSESMREIANYDEFKSALQELFTDLNINPKCNIILNLPMVHLGKIELSLLLNDESVTEAIISEVEQAYIFKRCEPLVSWFEASSSTASETRTIFYSAIQKTAVDKIKEVLSELGANLSSLEISLASTLRALDFSELTQQQMADGTLWNLMLVNSNGYSIVSMSGRNIVDYYEEPLALKTYEPEEIYEAINTSAQISLMSFPANYLYIVSETDLVSAGLLASKLQIEGQINYLENNSFKKREIIPVSLNILPDQVMKISLESIGIAVAKIVNYPMKLEFLGNNLESGSGIESISFHFNDKEIVLTEDVLKKITMVIAGILILPSLAALLTLPMLQKNKQASLDEINSKIKTTESEIKRLTDESSDSGSFVVKTEIENVLKNNRAKLMAYSSLGESVPKNLWITYFKTSGTGKIDIKGVSENVEEIYVFFRNLKDSLIDSQLRLYKLEMQSDSIEDAVASNGLTAYEFEITNMSEAEMNPAAAQAAAEAAAQAAQAVQDAAKQQETPKKNGLNLNSKKINNLEPVDIPAE